MRIYWVESEETFEYFLLYSFFYLYYFLLFFKLEQTFLELGQIDCGSPKYGDNRIVQR